MYKMYQKNKTSKCLFYFLFGISLFLSISPPENLTTE